MSALVLALALAQDDKTVISGSGDTTIKFWDRESGKLLCTLLAFKDGEWVLYTEDDRFDASQNARDYIGFTKGKKTYGPDRYWDDYHVEGLFSKVMKR